MSALVDRAIDGAGLAEALAARRSGTLSQAHIARVRGADLLALGATADRVRKEEMGDDVRIYTADPEDGPDARATVLPSADEEVSGLELLRAVAVARLTLPPGARVRIDWTRCGLELAQVALGFGANELVGRIATKRGLPIAEGQLAGVGKKSQRISAQLVKQRELLAYVRRAGREPVLVGLDGAIVRPDPVADSATRPEDC